MDTYRVKTLKEKKNINVYVPGSKSITNRALILAAMSDDMCRLEGVLFSDDSRAFLDCLINLGFHIDIDEDECLVLIKGENRDIPNKKATVNVRSAGTAARFITVLLAVVGGDFVLNSSEQMKKRPMKQLLDALINNGVEIEYMEEQDHFPFKMHSNGMDCSDIEIDTTKSSQYASALLMTSSINGMKVHLTGSRVNGAYIGITLKMMEQFGIDVYKEEDTYRAENKSYHLDEYNVEPDVSGACYFYAMALILRTKSTVKGIHLDSMQGDIKFLNVLEQMGCKVRDDKDGVEVDATQVKKYSGIEIDMSDFSDQALTMAVVCAFAESSSRIKNIGHIRAQECDRVAAIVNNLNSLGCDAKVEEKDGETDVIITPGQLHGAEIETYDDHRVAMSFAMAGLAVENVVIKNPMCCKKTFENYFKILDEITK